MNLENKSDEENFSTIFTNFYNKNFVKTNMENKEVTNQDLLKCLMDFKLEVKNDLRMNKEDTKKMDDKISSIDDKIERLKRDTEDEATKNKEREISQDERMIRMEQRLNKYDEECKRMKYQKIKQNKLRQMDSELAFQPTDSIRHPTESAQTERDPLLLTASSYSSDWAKTLEEASLPATSAKPVRTDKSSPKTDDKNTTPEKTKVTEVKKVHKKNKGMKALKRWFGDETMAEEDDTDDDIETEQWKTVDRVQRSKQRAKAANRKKAIKIEQINEKASHIVGIGPINADCLEFYREKNDNYEVAKTEAVKDWLNNFLKFNDTEIEDMKIKETLTSAKGDGIMYVAFSDKSDIAKVYARIAESGNSEISTRNYIPPQASDRYMMLNRKCKELRERECQDAD